MYKLSEKENLADSYSSVFDQNVSYEEKETFKNREYFHSFHGNQLDEWGNNVLYTRTQFIKDYSDVIDNYKKEQREQIMSILMTLGLALIIILFSKLLSLVGSGVIGNALGYLGTIISIFVSFLAPFFIIGFVIRMFRQVKMKNRALRVLEERKQEHMTNGTYDSGR